MHAPLMEEYVLEAAEKQLSATAVEPRGSRMVTGGMDSVLKYWDFAGLVGNRPKPFRQFVPVEAHAINSLDYAPVGNLLLCVAGTSRARIFDRDGSLKPVLETAQGDPYVRTPENTHGHTHAMTSGRFHPTSAEYFMTAGTDATVRLWDINAKRVGMDQHLPQTTCLKAIDARGICGGISVTTANYSSDGLKVAAGCSDGSIQIFSAKAHRHCKPELVGRTCHSGEVTHLEISGNDLISRSMDGTLKLWDIRKIKSTPVRVWENLSCNFQHSNFAVTEPGHLLVGTSDARLVSINWNLDGIQGEKKLQTRGIIRTVYNAELNQVFVGCSDGNLFIFYDREKSDNGALLFVDKVAARRDPESSFTSSAQPIFNYEELIAGGEYRETRTGRIRKVTDTDYEVRLARLKEMQKPTMTVTADPVVGFGMKAMMNEDPREALLAFASEADAAAEYTGAAYKESQPKKLLDYTEESTPADELLRAKKICPRCGLKICTCGYMQFLATGISSEALGPSVSSKKAKY